MRHGSDFLEALDPEQRQVAEHPRGAMVVLAGAGTGKTRAITYRIANAVRSGAMDARHILAVTFTARAAGEMRSRLRDLGVGNVQARTFHSAALSQLQYFWPSAIGGRVPELKESKMALVAAAAAQLGMPTDKPSIRDLASEIEWSKVSLVSPGDYPARAAALHRPEVAGQSAADIAQLIRAYEDVKAERGVIDFEDVILVLIGIMLDRPDITRMIRDQYRYFVVDEYQDLSPMQHRLLQLWVGDRRDLCVVGDPAQTIYSFTGASSRYLEGFSREFSDAKVVTLHRDYRSTPQVVDLANAVMAKASAEGSMGAVHLTAMRASGRPVEFDAYATDSEEAQAIAGKILEAKARGVALSDIAILYRTNAQSMEFENALSAAGISYSMHGSERFFNKREVREAMVALRATARSEQASSPDDRLTLPELVEGTLRQMGWRPDGVTGQGSARERWESLDSLRSLAASLWESRRASIAEYVAELEERANAGNAPDNHSVVLSSLHGAKGLEWNTVFLAGMSEGLLPISYARTDAEIAEERRLLYVGITRAQGELHISYAKSRGSGKERKLSRFLEPLWPKAAPAQAGGRKRSKARNEDFALEHGSDMALFEDLRDWRVEVSEAIRKPAYVVLHDSTLQRIAIDKPRTLAELGKVRGIGANKLMAYGNDIVQIVRAYLGED